LSATSAGVGWVLIDERAGYPDTDAAVLDDDAFEVDADDVLAERCAAAARGARGIAASSGDDIGAIGLICSDDVGVHAEAIVAALKSAGFDDVRTVPREFLDDGDAGELRGGRRRRAGRRWSRCPPSGRRSSPARPNQRIRR